MTTPTKQIRFICTKRDSVCSHINNITEFNTLLSEQNTYSTDILTLSAESWEIAAACAAKTFNIKTEPTIAEI